MENPWYSQPRLIRTPLISHFWSACHYPPETLHRKLMLNAHPWFTIPPNYYAFAYF